MDTAGDLRGRSASVAVVVPTLNAARTLNACLQSLCHQTSRPRVVVVDNHSTDDTARIARALATDVLVVGPERSAQRNAGAFMCTEEVVGFVDADMVLDREVVAQSVEAILGGAASVIVPEVSFGHGFWARVIAYERTFVRGFDRAEAPRFYRRDVFTAAGGWDEHLDAGEDWDLAIRTRAAGPVCTTEATIRHDEGATRYLDRCRKKAGYAIGLRSFADKHGPGPLVATINRPYVRRPWLLASHPVLGGGLVLLRVGEVAAVLLALAFDWARRRPVRAVAWSLTKRSPAGE